MELTGSIRQMIERIDRLRRQFPDRSQEIAAVIAGGDVDVLPLYLMPKRPRAIPGNVYSMTEQFQDPLKMLHSQLEDILSSVMVNGGAPLCVRPNFGTVFMPAMLGMEFSVPEDNYPWLSGHLSRQEFLRRSPRDPMGSDMMGRTLEYIGLFRELLPDWIHVYMPDTQGPFDIAHLIFGNDIFYSIMDEPEFVHELVDYSTQLYIDVTLRLKKALGEPEDQCYHGHALPQGLRMTNGGARVSEDTPTLLSPAHIDEFVLPYDRRALERFGGGFIHFCGRNEYLLQAFMKMEPVRVINLGNPESYCPADVMGLAMGTGTAYFGPWPRLGEESPEQYVARMRALSGGGRRGLLLQYPIGMFPGLAGEDMLRLWTA